MTYLTTFMLALLSTLLVGAVTRIVVDLFAADERTAPVAAVAVAAGYSLRAFSYNGPADAEALMALIAASGSLVAVFALWFRLLKRPVIRHQSNSED